MKHIPVEAFEAAEAVPTPENAQCDIKDALAVFRPKSEARSTVLLAEAGEAAPSPSYAGREPSEQEPQEGTREPRPWYNRREIDGYKVSRVIPHAERQEAYARWRHAARRGTPLNRHLIFKPATDHLSPIERMRLWEGLRQRIRCQCQACRMECVMISSRESDPTTHGGEHLHVLLHVPRKHQPTFDRLAPGWAENTIIQPADQSEDVEDGKVRSAFSYVHKAAAPQSTYRDSTIKHRKSGAILGDRTWGTMNLRIKARQRFETTRAAEVRIHRERSASSSKRPVPPQATTAT